MDQSTSDTGFQTKEAPAHSFRISLNLTRRVVRRTIEIDQTERAPRLAILNRRALNEGDSAHFLFSLRILRRVVRRLIEQAGDMLNRRPA